jgi:hypothetical protein
VVNPNLDDQKYLLVLTSAKKKINIAKIEQTLMSCIVNLGVGQFPKHYVTKESAIFVMLRGLKMKNTFS